MGQEIEAMEAGNKEEIIAHHGSRNSQNDDSAGQGNNDAMQDFSIDDLYGLFQGDESANDELGFDGENHLPSFEASGTPQDIVASSAGGTMVSNKYGESKANDSTIREDNKAAENASGSKSAAKNKGKRRRQSIKIDVEKGLPPPSWHSEAADRQHRQLMVVEM